MPLIKVTSIDAKLTKLVSANDIKSLKEKGNQNVSNFVIEKVDCLSDTAKPVFKI